MGKFSSFKFPIYGFTPYKTCQYRSEDTEASYVQRAMNLLGKK